jgi:hypothetical protein
MESHQRRQILSLQAKLKILDDSIALAIGDNASDEDSLEENDLLRTTDDEIHQTAHDAIASREDLDITPEEVDEYLNKRIRLPHGGELVKARVIKRSRDGDGLPVGTRNPNPVLDSRQYEVEFDDGSVAVYTANIIAKNPAAMTDTEERPHAWFRGIIDHRTVSDDTSMPRSMMYTDKRGVSKPRSVGTLRSVGGPQVDYHCGTSRILIP